MAYDIVSNIIYWTILNGIVQYCLKLPNIVEYCLILSNIVQYCSILFKWLFPILCELWCCKEHSDIVQYCQILPNIDEFTNIVQGRPVWIFSLHSYKSTQPFQIGFRCSKKLEFVQSSCQTANYSDKSDSWWLFH